MSRDQAKEELRQVYQREEKRYQAYIPAKPKVSLYGEEHVFRVCAYCCVSTENDGQLSSFELHQSHYKQLVMDHPNWELKHIYADEGISGTSLKKDRAYYNDFARVPFDYYEDLQEKIADMIPDFRFRLKVDPRTRKMVFAADVHSVFDICWFTFAKKLAEDPTPDELSHKPEPKAANKGLVMSCPFCGEAYVRTANRAICCGKPECTRARKRMNKRNSRKKQRITAQQSK